MKLVIPDKKDSMIITGRLSISQMLNAIHEQIFNDRIEFERNEVIPDKNIET